MLPPLAFELARLAAVTLKLALQVDVTKWHQKYL
jgi:hypothetical protein